MIPVLVLIGDRSIIFNVPGHLDPWIYFALFRHPVALNQLFPNTYYASRLSFILPGYLIHQVLSPLAATYVFHLLVWLCAVLSLYTTVKYLADRRTALLSAVIFGFYPYLWKATGWDYPDGAGIAYYLLTIACLTVAAGTAKLRPSVMVLAGASCAAAFYTNMVWMMLVPFLPIFWIGLRRARRHPLDVARGLFWTTIGAAFCTIVLAILGHRIGGGYLFYAPSILFALQSVNAPNPYKAAGGAWVGKAYWLFLPAMAVVAALAATLTDRLRSTPIRSKTTWVVCGNLLFCAGVFVFWEIRGMGLLEWYYYASCLMGPVFVFLGARVWAVPEGMSKRVYWSLLGFIIVLFFLTWWDHSGKSWAWLAVFGKGLPLFLALSAIVTAAICRASAKTLAAAVCATAIIAFGARPIGVIFVNDPVPIENAFHRIVESGQYCELYRKGRSIRFWYGTDKNRPEFSSINSLYFYGLAQLGLDFPKLPAVMPDLTNSLLVVLSTHADATEEAERSLRGAGLKARLVDNRRIAWSNVDYTLAFFEFEATKSQ